MGALNIKDPLVAEKARRLAKLTGKNITKAVSDALDQCLKTEEHKTSIDRERREREVDEILARFRAKIPPDAPTYEQIMEEMYDENGLPR
jgi:antitoxin VapB